MQKQLPSSVIDDMLLFSLAVQFEHTKYKLHGQKMNKIAPVQFSVFVSVVTCILGMYLQYKLGTCTCRLVVALYGLRT